MVAKGNALGMRTVGLAHGKALKGRNSTVIVPIAPFQGNCRIHDTTISLAMTGSPVASITAFMTSCLA